MARIGYEQRGSKKVPQYVEPSSDSGLPINLVTAKGSLISKPWKINYSDVSIVPYLLYQQGMSKEIIPLNDPNFSHLIDIENIENAFDNNILTKAHILLDSYFWNDPVIPTGVSANLEVLLNIPLNIDHVDIVVSDEKYEQSQTGLSILFSYDNLDSDNKTPDETYNVSVITDSEKGIVKDMKVYRYFLDKDKRLFAMLLSSSYEADIYGIYMIVSNPEQDVKVDGPVSIKDTSDTQVNPATSDNQSTAITKLDAIKTQTDKLTFDAGNLLKVNVAAGGAGYEVVGLKDSSDTRIDPATSGNQDTAISTLGDIKTNTTGLATESTVSSIDGKVATESTLSDVKSRQQKDSTLYYTEQGQSFVSPGYFTSLSNGSKKYFLFDLSSMSGLEAIMEILGVSLQAEAVCRIYKSPTISANGTSLPITNTNMASSTTSNMKTYEDPTISSNGTKIFEVYLPGATTGGFFSSPYGLSAVVLKDMKLSGKVLVEIENVSGSTMDYGTLIVRWRER